MRGRGYSWIVHRCQGWRPQALKVVNVPMQQLKTADKGERGKRRWPINWKLVAFAEPCYWRKNVREKG